MAYLGIKFNFEPCDSYRSFCESFIKKQLSMFKMKTGWTKALFYSGI